MEKIQLKTFDCAERKINILANKLNEAIVLINKLREDQQQYHRNTAKIKVRGISKKW